MWIVLLVIGIIVLGTIVGLGLYKLSQKSAITRELLFISSVNRHGHDSMLTISYLIPIVENALKEEGVEVVDISLAHEMGNRYQGILTILNEGSKERYEFAVVADSSCNIQWWIGDLIN